MSAPRWLTPTEQHAWRGFLATTARVFEALDRQLQRDAGMPHGYYMILAMLSESPRRSRRMSELAVLVQSSPSRLSHAVARLEENGWVTRAPASTDRRGTVASLTDAGFQALAAAAPGHVAAVRDSVFDQLTDTQVSQLIAIDAAVLRHLDGSSPASPGSCSPADPDPQEISR